VIRTARRADAPSVTALDAALFGAEAWSAESVAAELCGERRRAVVAVRPDGDLAGYAVTVLAGDTADLARIGVAPSLRRTGLATAMLTTLSSQAVLDGAERMLAEVAADNEAALAFYGAAGFTDVGRRKRYYRDGGDALVLGRRLTRFGEEGGR
jgi:ribosomal-protein-alanine N-acetyltransferase